MVRFLLCFILCIYDIFTVATGEYVCDGKPCPQEKPYCMTAGCISKCPENSFENGTRCVLNCGDGVVDDNKCRDVCPVHQNYTVDKTVVVGNTFQRLRFCFHDCKSFDIHSFAYENTCVSECPGGFKFVVNNTCTPKCPNDQPLQIEKTSTNQTYIKCVRKCPKHRPFLKNQTCVSQCNDGEVIFEGSCVTNCPNDSYIEYNNICMIDCPSDMYRTNTSCTDSCSVYDFDHPGYIYNQTCVEKCPDDFRYLRTPMRLFENGLSRQKYCVKDCEDDYYFGRDCVQFCPSDTITLNKSCFSSCPTSIPFLLSEETFIVTDNFNIKPGFKNRCVAECPIEMFYDNNTCTKICESHAINRICVEKCPATLPLSLDGQCLSECSEGTFKINFLHDMYCVKSCPHFSYNNECVTNCSNTTFKENNKCVNECQENMYYNGDECVSRCPKGNVVYNQTCTEACPSDAPFLYDYCKLEPCYKYDTTYHPTVCAEKCPGSFALNFTCVKQCPYKVYNSQCIDECPKETPFIEEHSYPSYKTCVDKCSDGMIANGSTCIDTHDCRRSIIYDGKCLDICPDGMYWIGYSMSCQSRWFFYGAIIGPLILIVVLFVACTKFFRLQPSSYAMGVMGYGIKLTRWKSRQPKGYQLMHADAFTNGSGGNNVVV